MYRGVVERMTRQDKTCLGVRGCGLGLRVRVRIRPVKVKNLASNKDNKDKKDKGNNNDDDTRTRLSYKEGGEMYSARKCNTCSLVTVVTSLSPNPLPLSSTNRLLRVPPVSVVTPCSTLG